VLKSRELLWTLISVLMISGGSIHLKTSLDVELGSKDPIRMEGKREPGTQSSGSPRSPKTLPRTKQTYP
jgi:hypothetical protein